MASDIQQISEQFESSSKLTPEPVKYKFRRFSRRISTLEPASTSETAPPFFTIINDNWHGEEIVVRTEKPPDLRYFKAMMKGVRNGLSGRPCLPAREVVPPGSIIASIRYVTPGGIRNSPYFVVTMYHKDRRGRPDSTDRVLLHDAWSKLGPRGTGMYSIDMPVESKLGSIFWSQVKFSWLDSEMQCYTQDDRVLSRWHDEVLTFNEQPANDDLGWFVAIHAAVLRDLESRFRTTSGTYISTTSFGGFGGFGARGAGAGTGGCGTSCCC